MKLRWILILLIAVLAIGSVHAEESQMDTDIAHDTNITVPEKMWAEDLEDIQVELPQNAQGNLSIKINHQTIYNNYTQEKSFKIPIILPKDNPQYSWIPGWPAQSKTYYISAFYNDVKIDMIDHFEVMDHNRSYDYTFVPREVLQYGPYDYQVLNFPSTSEGYINVYVDDVFFKKMNVTRWTFIDGFKNLTLGTHTLRIEYSGDDYFMASNRTFSFNVSDVIISLSDTLVLDHNDCVSVDVLDDAKCNVEIYVDGKLFNKGVTNEYGNYIFSLFDLKCTTHEIEVKVKGKYAKTLKKTVNVTYYIDVDSNRFTYGPDNTYMILLPEDLNPERLILEINGVRYTDFVIENGCIDLDISNLKKGNYSIFVEYLGDEKYYRCNASGNFTVNYEIICPFYFSGTDVEIYLNLPSGASGNLTLLVDGEFFKSVQFKNDYASITIDSLAPGYYDFEVFYDGRDFEVTREYARVIIEPELYYEMDIEAGQKETITVLASKNSQGYVIFYINNRTYNVTLKDGRARITLSNLAVGEHEFKIYYVGSNGYNTTRYGYIFVDYTTPKIKATNKIALATQNDRYSFYVIGRNAKPLKNSYVYIKIANKLYKVKTNSKGYATVSIPKLKAGKYNILISYGGVKVLRKLTVRHIVTLYPVKVKKSAKRLILTVKLAKKVKNRVIIFKFNGKTFKAKTNAYGVAKVSVKKSHLSKLKAGRKVAYSASFQKDRVVRISKVLR